MLVQPGIEPATSCSVVAVKVNPAAINLAPESDDRRLHSQATESTLLQLLILNLPPERKLKGTVGPG